MPEKCLKLHWNCLNFSNFLQAWLRPSARHMAGLPLNHQLTDLAGTLVERTTTAPCYKLYALADGQRWRSSSGTQGGNSGKFWRARSLLHWNRSFAGKNKNSFWSIVQSLQEFSTFALLKTQDVVEMSAFLFLVKWFEVLVNFNLSKFTRVCKVQLSYLQSLKIVASI